MGGSPVPFLALSRYSGRPSTSLEALLTRYNLPTVLAFYGERCPACCDLAKEMEALALEFHNRILFVMVNCENGGADAEAFGRHCGLKHCLHFHQGRVPEEFACRYIPHVTVIRND